MPDSRYDDDPRVVRVSGDEFRLPDGVGHWTVRRSGEVWFAFDQNGVSVKDSGDRYGQRPLAFASADEAIAAVIGAPR